MYLLDCVLFCVANFTYSLPSPVINYSSFGCYYRPGVYRFLSFIISLLIACGFNFEIPPYLQTPRHTDIQTYTYIHLKPLRDL